MRLPDVAVKRRLAAQDQAALSAGNTRGWGAMCVSCVALERGLVAKDHATFVARKPLWRWVFIGDVHIEGASRLRGVVTIHAFE